jgi:hypothetical protein
MSTLRSVPPPKARPHPPLRVGAQLYRELGWLELYCGPYEVNAYWSHRLPHRWRRFELKSRAITAGPFMALVSKRGEEPELTVIEGGR